jgi:meiotic recombination protein SPO11
MKYLLQRGTLHRHWIHSYAHCVRDIYYRDPALFSHQAVVDRYVDDLAFTFGISRAFLNVVRAIDICISYSLLIFRRHKTAAAKGLIAGAFTITRADGTMTSGLAERDVSVLDFPSYPRLTK